MSPARQRPPAPVALILDESRRSAGRRLDRVVGLSVAPAHSSRCGVEWLTPASSVCSLSAMGSRRRRVCVDFVAAACCSHMQLPGLQGLRDCLFINARVDCWPMCCTRCSEMQLFALREPVWDDVWPVRFSGRFSGEIFREIIRGVLWQPLLSAVSCNRRLSSLSGSPRYWVVSFDKAESQVQQL